MIDCEFIFMYFLTEYSNNTDLVPRHTSLIVCRIAGNQRPRKSAKIQLRSGKSAV